MNARSQDIEAAFSAAYRDKFLQFLDRNSSPLTASDREVVCGAVASSCAGGSPWTAPPPPPAIVASRAVGPGVTGGRRSLVRCSIIIILLAGIAYVSYLILKEIGKTKKGLLSAALPQIDVALAWESKPVAPETLELAVGGGIPGEGTVIVMFHADWCGHCQKAKGPYAKVAKTFKAAKLKMCDDNCLKALPPAHKKMKNGAIDAFPTFVAFKDGQELNRHSGGLDEEAMHVKFGALCAEEAPAPGGEQKGVPV